MLRRQAGAAGVARAGHRSRDRRDHPARAEEGSQQALSGRRDVREGARASVRQARHRRPARAAAADAAAVSQSAGGKSRAVQRRGRLPARARGARSNARDAARRFAVEALAEDPSHAAARAFLAGLEQKSPAAATQASSRAATLVTSAGETAVGGTAVGGTLVGGTAVGGAAGATAVSGGVGTFGGRTSVGSSQSDRTSAFSSAPTIIVTPGAVKPPAAPSRSRIGSRRCWALGARTTRRRKRRSGHRRNGRPPSGESPAAFWMRHRWTALAVAVPLLVIIIVRGDVSRRRVRRRGAAADDHQARRGARLSAAGHPLRDARGGLHRHPAEGRRDRIDPRRRCRLHLRRLHRRLRAGRPNDHDARRAPAARPSPKALRPRGRRPLDPRRR